jgi:hypothetical protein
MYNFANLTTLHIEITNKCQASCPMCVRICGKNNLSKHLDQYITNE